MKWISASIPQRSTSPKSNTYGEVNIFMTIAAIAQDAFELYQSKFKCQMQTMKEFWASCILLWLGADIMQTYSRSMVVFNLVFRSNVCMDFDHFWLEKLSVVYWQFFSCSHKIFLKPARLLNPFKTAAELSLYAFVASSSRTYISIWHALLSKL